MKLGVFGEDAASTYLEKRGYKIIEKNFRCRAGEIDIIAAHGESIVFIEVKTRRSLSYGLPCEAITHAKKQHIKRVISFYVLLKGLSGKALRIDVMEVYIKEEKVYIHHMEDAF
ncbi:MAG: YraN family protein [Eubacteriales bacterium]|nr:YraN family protein [Eubacteriales bacterium]MDD3350090.1 YraN family protein [Eubacteriales bacterium]